MKTALITGVTGQDGSYLAEQLLAEGMKVYGLVRRTSQPNMQNLKYALNNKNFHIIEGDITDSGCMHRVIRDLFPSEIYNLAAQSFVKASFDEPSHTWDVTAKGAMNLLDAVRCAGAGLFRVYQASSSEMFGTAYSTRYCLDNSNRDVDGSGIANWSTKEGYIEEKFQNEDTPMHPCSPYAIAKLAAHHAVRVARESHGMHAVSGILLNHESPRRGEAFVTRKITRWVGRVAVAYKHNKDLPKLSLGNPDARRDWGFAPDYMRAAVLMVRAEKPIDYVISTGETHSVRDFLAHSMAAANLSTELEHELIKWQTPQNMRAYEVPYLRGNSDKAAKELGWKSTTSFERLVSIMVDSDINLAMREYDS